MLFEKNDSRKKTVFILAKVLSRLRRYFFKEVKGEKTKFKRVSYFISVPYH
jgi:hypothetical protein